MRNRLIARVALSALLLTGMLVVKADDSETGGPWKQNYKNGRQTNSDRYYYRLAGGPRYCYGDLGDNAGIYYHQLLCPGYGFGCMQLG